MYSDVTLGPSLKYKQGESNLEVLLTHLFRLLHHPGSGRGIKLVGVPQPKLMHGFSQNFQCMFTRKGSRAD